jgi:hypothetical protein
LLGPGQLVDDCTRVVNQAVTGEPETLAKSTRASGSPLNARLRAAAMQAGLTERLKRNLLSEAAFRGVEECRVCALRNGPADELPYSGSASGRLTTIDDGSAHV